jgi:flagellar P-ring protein precursor FlgI
MVPTPFDTSEHIVLNVKEADFSTTTAITEAVNDAFGLGTAKALDGVSIAIAAPTESSQRVSFLSMIENLDVAPRRANGKGRYKFTDGHCSDQP